MKKLFAFFTSLIKKGTLNRERATVMNELLNVSFQGRISGFNSPSSTSCLLELGSKSPSQAVFPRSLFPVPCSLFLILVNSMAAQAISQRTVYVGDIETAALNLKIFAGYGLTINFQATGETVKQVWLGDPTRYSFTSNGNLCAKSSSECEGSPATVIFLRQIKPIAFPNMTSSSDGSTQITILTDLRQYQFKLIAASGQPQYTSLVVKPQSEKPLPIPVASNRATTVAPLISRARKNSQQVQKPTPNNSNSGAANSASPPAIVTLNRTAKPIGTTLQRDDANALVYGLALFRRQGTIKPNSATWRKVQDAIKLLRQGNSKETAIKRSGVGAELFNQLIEAGKI